jgi:hypothetical protein
MTRRYCRLFAAYDEENRILEWIHPFFPFPVPAGNRRQC